MTEDMKKLKDEFEATDLKPSRDDTCEFLSKQLKLLEKHSLDDESVNSLGFRSKVKPQEMAAGFRVGYLFREGRVLYIL